MLQRGHILKRHGGARNAKNRATHNLSLQQCKRLIQAEKQAALMQEPFNRFTNINWQKCGVDILDNRQATSEYIKLASNWMRSRGYILKYAWVQEYGRINGAHVHILMHVPIWLNNSFRPWPTRWVKRVLAKQGSHCAYCAKAQRTYKIGAYHDKLTYMMKAASRETAQQLNLSRYGKGSTVYGKRAGTWSFPRPQSYVAA